jgi:hypothetical protein
MDIIDDYEKVTCRLCGYRATRIYGKHLKFKHNISTEEYKNKFPNAPLMSQKDLDSTYKMIGSKTIGFGIGYNFKDKNSNFMIAIKKAS